MRLSPVPYLCLSIIAVSPCRYGELQGRQLTSDLSALSLPDPAASDDMDTVVSAMQRSIPEAVQVRSEDLVLICP